MDALTIFIIAAFLIIIVAIVLVGYAIGKENEGKVKKGVSNEVVKTKELQLSLDNMRTSRDRLNDQIENLIKNSSSSPSSSSSSPSSSTLNKAIAEKNEMRFENERLKEEIQQLKSHVAIGFPIKFDEKDDNVYAKEMIKGFNLLMKEVKKIACRQFSDNLSQIEMSIKAELEAMGPDDLKCAGKEEDALKLLSSGLQGFMANITANTDMNGVMDAYTHMINTVMDRVCKNGSLDGDKMYQTILQLQNTICRE